MSIWSPNVIMMKLSKKPNTVKIRHSAAKILYKAFFGISSSTRSVASFSFPVLSVSRHGVVCTLRVIPVEYGEW